MTGGQNKTTEEAAVWEQVQQLLEQSVSPQLALHGGGAELLSIDGGTAVIRLTGRCSGCPASDLTAEQMILGELSRAFPQIRRVAVEPCVSEELMEQARALLRRSHGKA